MKVIVTYRKFHDVDRNEIFPEVFKMNENETPEDALRRIWQDQHNAILAENLNRDIIGDINDPLDEEGCWFEEDMAMITWVDGDTKEFYIVNVEDYKF